jgi:hypothetical protein
MSYLIKGAAMKDLLSVIQVILLCFLAPAFAQSPGSDGSKDTNQRHHATNAIFNEIMSTLPLDMKAKVDSAGINSVAARHDQKQGTRNSMPGKSPMALPQGVTPGVLREEAIKGLPEEVRGQVEKAISDIDLMNQNRQIQFKEYEKKHLGPK